GVAVLVALLSPSAPANAPAGRSAAAPPPIATIPAPRAAAPPPVAPPVSASESATMTTAGDPGLPSAGGGLLHAPSPNSVASASSGVVDEHRVGASSRAARVSGAATSSRRVDTSAAAGARDLPQPGAVRPVAAPPSPSEQESPAAPAEDH